MIHGVYLYVCECEHFICTCIDVAKLVFNRCSRNNATKEGKITPQSKEFRVEFNYEFLEDYRDPKSRSILNR